MDLNNEAPIDHPDPLTIAEQQEQDSGRVPPSTVQVEWDQTLKRLRKVCEVKDASTLVSLHHYANVLIAKTPALDIGQAEAVIFDNLLFSPWARCEHPDTFMISGQWLWRWRKVAPWKSEAVGHMIRLAPGSPQRMWTYRMNVIEVTP